MWAPGLSRLRRARALSPDPVYLVVCAAECLRSAGTSSVFGQFFYSPTRAREGVTRNVGCASVAGGAGRRSAAGHAANVGTNTSGADGLYPIEAWGLIVL